MDLEQIRRLVREGKLFYYAHALVEAKKDVVCDYSAESVIIIPTVYVPDSREWVQYRIRKPRSLKEEEHEYAL